MAYVTPTTSWATGDLVSANDLTVITNDLVALYSPPSKSFKANESVDYTTNSTIFANIDPTDGKFSLTVPLDVTGDVIVGFSGVVGITASSGTRSLYLDFTVDGTRQGGDDGIVFMTAPSGSLDQALSFTWLVTGLLPGNHVFNLQWKVAAGGSPAGTLYAGAGTSGKDFHPQFWVRKV